MNRQALGGDLIIPALAGAFAVYFLFSIAGLAWEAKANGIIIGSILLALIALQLLRMARRLYRGEAHLGSGSLFVPRDTLLKRVGVLAVAVAFIATLPWLGLTLGLLLSMFAALWVTGVRGRVALAALPAAVAAAAYLLFIALLQSDLPHGPIERLLS